MVDDQSVGARNVKTVFDEHGRDQQVIFALDELEHDPLEFLIIHLPVGDADARVRRELLHQRGHAPDRLHAVVHEVDLPLAPHLLQNGGLDDPVAEGRHHGLDRQAPARRGLDHRKIAQASERHIQRARDRRRRHGEHVHVGLEFLQLLLRRHAEALLLVHDQEPEIVEAGVLRKQAVRADQDVDLAGFRLRQDFLLLSSGAEAADHLDAQRERRHALAEGREVLEGQNGGGRKHRHLLAVLRHFEGGAHGELGLAVPDVAAQQAVHGLRALEVVLDVLERGQLVGRLFELERFFKLLLPGSVGAVGYAAAHLALGVEPEELLGHVAERALHPRLGARPRDAPQAVERGLGAVAARTELFHQVEPFERNIKPGVVLVGEQHEVSRRAFHAELPQPLVKPDAVVDVYHVVALFEVAQVGNEARRPRPLPPARRAPVEAAEEVRVAEQQQPQFGDDDAFRHPASDEEGGGRKSGVGCR